MYHLLVMAKNYTLSPLFSRFVRLHFNRQILVYFIFENSTNQFTAMKAPKFVYFFLLSLCFTLFWGNNQSQAQEIPVLKQENKKDKKWHWGLKAGLNAAQIRSFTPLSDTIGLTVRSRLNVTGHLFVQYQINKHFSLESGLQYSSKGVNHLTVGLVGSMSSQKSTILFRINYLELPIISRFHLSFMKAKYTALIGIAPAYMLRANLVKPFLNDMGFLEYASRPWEDVRQFDFNGIIGVGLEVPTSKQKAFLFELRYTQGFLQIIDYPESVLNNVVSALVGFKF